MKNNNNIKAMFIKTKDLETSENLKRAGFDLIDYSNNTWTYINDEKCLLTFDDNKVVYTNILNF